MLGAQAGLTLPAPRLYFGLSFSHYSGYTDLSQAVHMDALDVEFGYELYPLKERLFIRPQAALGAAQTVTIQSDNAGYPLAFHWAPGVVVGVRVALLLISAEYRREMIPGGWPSSNSVLFGCGLRF